MFQIGNSIYKVIFLWRAKAKYVNISNYKIKHKTVKSQV